MKYLRYLWWRLRIAFIMRGMSPEEQKRIINQILLEVKLEQYSRSLRSAR